MSGEDETLDLTEQDLETPDTETQETLENPASEVNPALLPAANGNPQGAPRPALTNWEQRYKSSQAKFQQMGSKMKSIEALMQNPKLRELAKNDPTIAEALAKAGYQHVAEQEQQNQGEKLTLERIYDEHYQAAAANNIRWALRELQDEMKRPLSKEEKAGIFVNMRDVPGLSVEQAWRLSDGYQKQLKAAEDKRVADATKQNPGVRPRPMTPLMPGQKLDMKKPVTEMNEAERRQHIADTLAKHGG